ncbi:unnamed protein product [Effrenium voratum]|nr:unnamed protein product [Effrenium voratum]
MHAALPSPPTWTPSAAECKKSCEASATCEVFTWKEDTVPTGGCWLMKAADVTEVADPKASSGKKGCAAIAAKEFQEDLGAGPVAAAAPSGDNSMVWALLGGGAAAALAGGMVVVSEGKATPGLEP